MSSFTIDFNPPARRRLRGAAMLALGAAAFAAASDMRFEQQRVAEEQAHITLQRIHQKESKEPPPPARSLEFQRAADERIRNLAYDWNPVLAELEAAAGEGLVVRQFTHEISTEKSTFRLESNDLGRTVDGLGRITKVLPENRAITIDAMTQEIDGGQAKFLTAVTIAPRSGGVAREH